MSRRGRAGGSFRRLSAVVLAAAMLFTQSLPLSAHTDGRAAAGLEAAGGSSGEGTESGKEAFGLEEGLDPVSTTGSQYDFNAELLDDMGRYPGVYEVTPTVSENIQTIGIESISNKTLENAPTTESPAIIMGAAVPYEKKTGPTEFTQISGGSLYAPYSYFRYEIIEEANLNGTGTHKKMSGFDGTYVIIRVDVSEIIKNAPDNSFLHVKQDHNKALMVKIGQEISDGVGTFSDAMGNKTYSYSLSGNAIAMKDKDGNYKEKPYLDIVLLSSGTLVQGADTGSSSPDPKAPLADFGLSLYIDQTADYDPEIVWNSSLGTAVDRKTGKAVTITEEETNAGITASDKVLAKYFDESKANEANSQISRYKIMGSDIELEMMVENEEGATTESGETEYWSLKKGMGYEKYNDHALKLICEAPLLTSINVSGSGRKVILDVNSFDIQLANHSETSAAAITVDGATLKIQDTFNTTGAELAVGNNATMMITNNGRLIIADSAQLEVEYDAASVSANAAPAQKLNNGVITVNNGGVIENHGIITVEGKEGKPQNAADAGAVVRDYSNAVITIGEKGTIENHGCMLVNGALYNLGSLKNYGKYSETITSNDPDKGTFTYHKGVQLSWKDDITQGHTAPGAMFNGVDEKGTVSTDAKLENEGDIVLIPGYFDNYASVDNKEAGRIYLCAVDEIVIPISPDADKPLVTEKRIDLGYSENSYFINTSTGIVGNSGEIRTADVEIVSNGRTGDIISDESRYFEDLNISSEGSVENCGLISVNALYAASEVTNSGNGMIGTVILRPGYDRSSDGRFTDSSSKKGSKVYNGSRTTTEGTDVWNYYRMKSLKVSDDTRVQTAKPGDRVNWTLTAEDDGQGKDVVYRVRGFSVNPAVFFGYTDIHPGESLEITSPVLPNIHGNAVFSFISDNGSDEAGSDSDNAVVKVTGDGFIRPLAVQGPGEDRHLVYNGEDQKLATQGYIPPGGRVMYKFKGDAEDKFSTQIPTAKNAGTYKVDYKAVKSDGAVVPGTTGEITVTIDKREAYIAADDRICKKGAEAKTLTYVSYGIVKGDEAALAITPKCPDFNGNTVGVYEINISYEPNDNYNFKTFGGTCTVIDTPAEFEVGVQAVMDGFGLGKTISVNIAYKTDDESKVS
ncbi:MAG: hypothetical protein IJT00_00700, partial [Lachnospiraceae bacterium]|nr:hypothetical protein [Lachnospiraceae bacterium]